MHIPLVILTLLIRLERAFHLLLLLFCSLRRLCLLLECRHILASGSRFFNVSNGWTLRLAAFSVVESVCGDVQLLGIRRFKAAIVFVAAVRLVVIDLLIVLFLLLVLLLHDHALLASLLSLIWSSFSFPVIDLVEDLVLGGLELLLRVPDRFLLHLVLSEAFIEFIDQVVNLLDQPRVLLDCLGCVDAVDAAPAWRLD